jgi:heat shock protein HslJ
MKKTVVLMGVLVLLMTLVASVAMASAAPPAARPAAQAATTLEGPRWVLVSFADKSGKTAQALPNIELTAQFENGRVTGSGGCNNYSAAYKTTGNKLTISQAVSTMMACMPQSTMDQEAAYLKNLEAAATYKIASNQLAIANAKGQTVLTYKATQPISLTNGSWLMTSYNNGKQAVVSALPSPQVTAVFSSTGQLSGSAGCNTYNASYKVDGNKIQIGAIATTRMMCEQPVMDQEQAYLAAIQKAATWDINGTTLQLRSADDALLAMYTHQAAAQPALTAASPTTAAPAATAAPAGTAAPTPAGDLTANPWQWVSFTDPKGQVKIEKPENYLLTFNKDGTLAIKADCNNAAGTYTIGTRASSSIDIKIGPTTMAACPAGSRGDQFVRLLGGAAIYFFKDGELYIDLFADGGTMALAPAATPASPAAAATAAPAQPAIAGALAGPDLKNTYVTLLPSADRGPRTITLYLSPDGKAEFTTRMEQETPIAQTGVWKDSGPNTVAVTLTEQSGVKMAHPTAITFQREGANLIAVQYDKNLFGQAGLKLNQASEVARRVQTGLFTLDLAAGFPLDPTFLSVNGGGAVDARLLSSACTGFINLNPVATVNWTGTADMVRAFFYSNGDATLVVSTPKGELLCNDNANNALLDPVVDIQNPPPGKYRIWVGTAAKNDLIPGVLVLTSKPDVNVDTFDLSRLIQRPAAPAILPTPTPQVESGAVQKSIQDALQNAPTFKAGAPLTTSVTAEGDIPLFQFPLTKTCAGLVSPKPSFVFTTTAELKQMRVFFEGDADSTLLVLGNGGKIVECSDDVQPDANVNPLVQLTNAPAGAYAVWVGRLNPSQPVKGKLTVTDATNAAPAVLAPTKK